MFNVTPAMEDAWQDAGKPKATPADIVLLESGLGARLPASYVDFVQRYGFVIFGDDDDGTSMFDYVQEAAGQREVFEGEAAFLYQAERALKVYRNMVDDSNPADETQPCIPRGFFTFGSDPGQGKLLIELATGKIWFWPERESRWGTGDNKVLGYVAPDFESFINGLKPEPL